MAISSGGHRGRAKHRAVVRSGGMRASSSSHYSATGRSSRAHRARFVGLALVVVVVAGVAAGLVRYLGAVPLPSVAVSALSLRFPGSARITWPAGDEATLSVDGLGTIASAGGEQPTPMASVTKIMAAYIILRDHPLGIGESGPSITVTASDVATYQSMLAAQDSVVAVQLGEKLTELQALEAALIPSGDNIVRMLAVWDAGSISAFVAKMNSTARQLGLTHTHYAGPSGVDPATVSTATDQVRLATLLMANPVFAGIVAMPSVSLPNLPLQYNVNGDLGKDGIVGIKTGWVPAGGASFVFAAHPKLASAIAATHRSLMVIGAVVGQQGGTPLPSALGDAMHLVNQVGPLLETKQVVSAGEDVATISAPYSSAVRVVTASPASLFGWPGAVVTSSVRIRHGLVAPIPAGTRVGDLVVRLGDERDVVPLVTAAALASPSLSWRVLR